MVSTSEQKLRVTHPLRQGLHFIVFNHLWISLCAVSMLCTTRWFLHIPWRMDALAAFVFFAAFFEYNLHEFVWHWPSPTPASVLQHLFREKPDTTTYCILTGFAGAAISFCFLNNKIIPFVFLSSLVTIAYSLPLVRWKNKFIRLREITWFKVFIVALVWTVMTVVVPMLDYSGPVSWTEAAIIFSRRFLFIYAITIPFEIKGMEHEKSAGNINLPMILGIRSMKMIGIFFLFLFCILLFVHEKFLAFTLAGRSGIFLPLLISALTAGLLIQFSSTGRNEWYTKFLTDGTMILQFLLLLLFN